MDQLIEQIQGITAKFENGKVTDYEAFNAGVKLGELQDQVRLLEGAAAAKVNTHQQDLEKAKEDLAEIKEAKIKIAETIGHIIKVIKSDDPPEEQDEQPDD